MNGPIENMKVFLQHMPKNEIKEVCFKNGHGDGMLNENFVMKLRQIFPCLEKLVIEPKIDSWDRKGDRCVILPKYLVRINSLFIKILRNLPLMTNSSAVSTNLIHDFFPMNLSQFEQLKKKP